jgi:hypothetical protein
MAATGTILVLTAGTLTFGNEWIQTHSINWRVPVATVLAAAVTDVLAKASPTAGTGLGIMALIVAATVPLNGKSPVQELTGILSAKSTTASTQKVT